MSRGVRLLRSMRGTAYEIAEALMSFRFQPEYYVVVNGFWRSGTTWVQEVIADAIEARRVFEPFESRNRPLVRYSEKLSMPRRDDAFVNAFFPFAEAGFGFEADAALRALIRRALAGGWYGIWSPHIPTAEKTLDELRKRYIVTKLVRANLCVGAIQREYNVPVIHVHRDPRAIIASLLYPNPKWAGATFEDFPLRAHLLEVDDGREGYFSKWRGEINELETMPSIARIAGYYCLTELYAMQTLNAGPGHALVVSYASLLRDGFGPVFSLLKQRGFPTDEARIELSRPSIAEKRDGGDGRSPSIEDRLFGWRAVLPAEDAELVITVVDQFGLSDRCDT